MRRSQISSFFEEIMQAVIAVALLALCFSLVMKYAGGQGIALDAQLHDLGMTIEALGAVNGEASINWEKKAYVYNITNNRLTLTVDKKTRDPYLLFVPVRDFQNEDELMLVARNGEVLINPECTEIKLDEYTIIDDGTGNPTIVLYGPDQPCVERIETNVAPVRYIKSQEKKLHVTYDSKDVFFGRLEAVS